MLLEAISYLTTPAAAHVRSIGYLKELIALDARYQRCRTSWQPHLEKTKNVIASAVDRCPRRKKAVVLGAGILADIPLSTLSEAFERVELVDICVLRKTKRILKTFPNVVLCQADVTGLALPLHAWTKGGGTGFRPESRIPADIPLGDADLVVSANVLSQLPLVPMDYLRRHGLLSEDEEAAFARGILENHFAHLATCPGTVCLISEVERLYCDGSEVLETENPLWGLSFDSEGNEWFWDIAPKAETGRDYDLRNRVRYSVRHGSFG